MARVSANQLREALRLRKIIDQLEAKIENTQSKLDALLSGGIVKKSPGRPAKKSAPRVKKAGKKRAKRAPRSGSGKELVHEVLRSAGKALTVDEIMEQLKAKGYTSKAKEPKKTLGVMLYTDKAIKRAGRGLFTLGKSVTPKAKTRAKAKRVAKKK